MEEVYTEQELNNIVGGTIHTPENGEIIPTESNVVDSINQQTSRYSGAVWFDEVIKRRVAIAGLGGIGSWTALLISRLSPGGMVIYDPDTVEAVNLAGQCLSKYHIGSKKNSSVANIIKSFSDYYNICRYDTYSTGSPSYNIMICGFDNMNARRVYFNNWLKYVNSLSDKTQERDFLYIDGRIKC